jgi:predicted nucleotide-binding protein
MRERFKGSEGRQRLVEVLANQELVLHDRALAQRLGEVAKVEAYEQGREIYIEGEPGKNHLYFVIAGAMDLLVKGKSAAIISAGQAFGEFPILDPGLPYTVTIRAREQSAIARVSEAAFRAIAQEYPDVWKNMAKMLMRRLHRTRDLIAPGKPPCVFIGHGGSKLWNEVRRFLEHDLSLKTVEYGSEPRAGIPVVSILEEMLSQATFAVLVLTAEDETARGGKRARQNVVHEAGLFQGVLGFRRAILLLQSGVEEFSNVAGLEHLAFEGDAIATTFDDLRGVLGRERQIRES